MSTSIRLAIILGSVSLLAFSSQASAEGATVIDEDFNHEGCHPAVIGAPPGSGLPPLEVTHCFSFSGSRHMVFTSSGNVIDRFEGDASFEDYDMDGNLVSSMEQTNTRFDLRKVYDDGVTRTWVHRDTLDQCVDSPWGFSAYFSIRELFIDGEWVYQVVDAEFSSDPC